MVVEGKPWIGYMSGWNPWMWQLLKSVKSAMRNTSPKCFEAYNGTPELSRRTWLDDLPLKRYPAWPGRITWCPPYSGWVKLNFSDAYYSQLGSNRKVVGYGGIFHDNECLHSYSDPLLEDLD